VLLLLACDSVLNHDQESDEKFESISVHPFSMSILQYTSKICYLLSLSSQKLKC